MRTLPSGRRRPPHHISFRSLLTAAGAAGLLWPFVAAGQVAAGQVAAGQVAAERDAARPTAAPPSAVAPPPRALSAPDPFAALLDVGMRQNRARRQQQLAVDRADVALREARGLYLPSATFNARYTELAGNTINLGTLINPAFGALNELLQRPAFPTNVDVQLPLRQETTVRLSQPVFQPAIAAATRLRAALADAQGAERDVHARQLAADIKSGYLTWTKIRAVVTLYDSTMPLLDEQLRVAERLVSAGKATPEMILRARAERSEVQQRRDQSLQLAEAARAALNMQLALPPEHALAHIPDSALVTDALPPLEEVRTRAVLGREELRQLSHARRAVSAQERLAQGSFLPAVSVALDYGVQGRDYRFDRSRDFAAFSVVVSWNLFNGGQDAARLQQAALDAERLDERRREVEALVTLEVTTTWQAAAVAWQAIGTADDRLRSARRTFEIVRRKQEEGAASQLEFLDARTAYTNAALNQLVTRYDYALHRVALERAAATLDLTPYTGMAARR